MPRTIQKKTTIKPSIKGDMQTSNNTVHIYKHKHMLSNNYRSPTSPHDQAIQLQPYPPCPDKHHQLHIIEKDKDNSSGIARSPRQKYHLVGEGLSPYLLNAATETNNIPPEHFGYHSIQLMTKNYCFFHNTYYIMSWCPVCKFTI